MDKLRVREGQAHRANDCAARIVAAAIRLARARAFTVEVTTSATFAEWSARISEELEGTFWICLQEAKVAVRSSLWTTDADGSEIADPEDLAAWERASVKLSSAPSEDAPSYGITWMRAALLPSRYGSAKPVSLFTEIDFR